jgi:hypothetical protein
MNRRFVPVLLVGILAAALSFALAFGSDTAKPAGKAAHAAAKPAMHHYLVVSPHTAEECMTVLDATSAAGTLSKFDFGCKSGDHTGYAMVTAASDKEALEIVPAAVRDKAKATMVSKFTAEDLKKIHESMEKK